METRRIGSLEVPVVGLGCNNFGRRIDEDASRAVIEAALEEGDHLLRHRRQLRRRVVREEFIGRALGARRDEVVIATKFGGGMDAGGGGVEHIRRPSRRRSGGSAPTGSTCISCTRPTR